MSRPLDRRTTLRSLQRRMATAIFDPAVLVDDLICDDGVGVASRLDIHRSNVREAFRNALSLDFPVVERLVGGPCFEGLALDYQRSTPSRSGDLHGVGAGFPAYLRAQFDRTGHRYLGDVAALAALPAERYEWVGIALAPCARLVHSDHSILRIWRSNQPSAAPENIDLGEGADRVLVCRVAARVDMRALAAAAFAFLGALDDGLPLGMAFERGLAEDPGFDPQSVLADCLSLGALRLTDPRCARRGLVRRRRMRRLDGL